jgi:isoleucyl-tRNA synthetase
MADSSKKYFESVDTQVNFPQLEEKILKFWQENKIFEKSVESRPENKKWTFLDGPPFVTGMPHYGHLLGSIHKDLFGRYQTMKGNRVRRVWGWDGHGLPIENKVEGKLEIKSKKDIENVVGVGKFIEECKKYVEEISGEWEWYVDHIGRWVDFKNAYKTWDRDYMESVMWVFKQMYDKGHIYKGLRVSLYCPHCATPISNFEVAMDADNYKELTEPANTYKYKVKDEDNTYLLAWSTTPWNKLATPALAVNPELEYIKVKQGDEYYILAKTTQKILKEEPKYEIVQTFMGHDLVGREFEPHFDYFKADEGKRINVVIPGSFVTADEGTGIVTIAAYGEDDLKAMNENNIQIVLHVDEEGHIKPEVPKFGGMYYLKVNPLVNQDLSERGLMYREDSHTHSVPNCWRCHTRLYYAPLDAWFVNIADLKPLLKKTNEEVNWFPKHFKTGRFLKSVESAPDWNISRNRYWGSPVPVWECECGERFVPGSIKELEERSGVEIKDLHKPFIDSVVVKCQKCGKDAKRVPEVLDSWIEAGSASFAERHFPFNDSQKLEDFYPPDFIAEYTGQIRAWFYVLHVIGAAIYGTPAFKNVGVEGVILGTDGRKMSKNLGNYPDPKELLSKYGGDALRLYMMGSPIMHGEDIIISEEEYRNQVRGTMLILWNVYNYFVTYANLDGWEPSGKKSEEVLDRWILSLTNKLILDVTHALDGLDTMLAINSIKEFVDQLSNWYVRRSRGREDKDNFYGTLHEVLVKLCQVLAPITPFMVEDIYKNLTKSESVHLSDWPQVDHAKIDEELVNEMVEARKIVEAAHAKRKEANIKVRQPLGILTTVSSVKFVNSVDQIVKDEVNVKEWKHIEGEEFKVELDTTLTPELEKEGEARELVRQIQDERKKIGTALDDRVDVLLPNWPVEFEDYIKTKALINTLNKGEFSVVKSQ